MTRIVGIELQDKWRLDFALTRIKGVSWSLAEKILAKSKLEGSKRVSELSADDVARVTTALEEYPTEGDLLRIVRNNVQRLKVTGAYRGKRHAHGLPSRGQRTRSNARTKRGKRKTVGAFKKDTLTKMASDKPAEKK